MNALHLTSHQWNHSAVQVGYKSGDHEAFLRSGTGKYEKVCPSRFLSEIVLNYFYTLDANSKLGL